MPEDNEKTGGKPEGDKKFGAAGVGAITRYSKENQPSGEAKSAGWAKRRKGADLLRHMLAAQYMTFDEVFKKKLADYFGFEVGHLDDLSNEGVIYMSLIVKAQKSGDVAAANALLDRAWGKPKEFIEHLQGDTRPEFVVQVINSTPETPQAPPPVAEDDNDLIEG